jgi:hypothetical protein
MESAKNLLSLFYHHILIIKINDFIIAITHVGHNHSTFLAQANAMTKASAV